MKRLEVVPGGRRRGKGSENNGVTQGREGWS